MSVVATGLGLVSPLGHSSPTTCAAIRAGISNFVELESLVDRDGDPVVASVLEPLALAKDPFEPTLKACREAVANCSMLHSQRVTISILACERSRASAPLIDESRVELLASALRLGHWDVFFYREGNAAGFKAMTDVQARLEQDPGVVELVVGADSLVDLPILAQLERSDRLKGSAFPRGVIPGEACACVVFQHEASAPRRSGERFIRLVSAHSAVEYTPAGGDGPCLATGLTGAIQGAIQRAGWSIGDVAQVYCDLNGEADRAHEWALAACRSLDDPDIMHPADCVGDVGAAFGPLLLCQAATAMQRGYAKSNRALAFCASDGGLRASVCLELIEG